jgi:hypothetical protein
LLDVYFNADALCQAGDVDEAFAEVDVVAVQSSSA